MSFDRDNPILIGAAIIVLMGEQDDDLAHFDKFCTSMGCFDYEVIDCYHVVEDINSAYDRNLRE